jgi:hypothetical protein
MVWEKSFWARVSVKEGQLKNKKVYEGRIQNIFIYEYLVCLIDAVIRKCDVFLI